jgi:hypothetical protein
MVSHTDMRPPALVERRPTRLWVRRRAPKGGATTRTRTSRQRDDTGRRPTVWSGREVASRESFSEASGTQVTPRRARWSDIGLQSRLALISTRPGVVPA